MCSTFLALFGRVFSNGSPCPEVGVDFVAMGALGLPLAFNCEFGLEDRPAHRGVLGEEYVVKYVWRRTEGGDEFWMFCCHVVAVEAVEVNGGVAGLGDDVFPALVVGLHRVGDGGLDDENPWAQQLAVPATQYLGFEAFDVNLEPVDVLAAQVTEGRSERCYGNADFLVRQPSFLLMPSCIVVNARRQSGVRDEVELQRSFPVGQCQLQYGFIRTVGAQEFGILRYGFDVRSAPSLFVKRKADGVYDRVLCANVDVAASSDVR